MPAFDHDGLRFHFADDGHGVPVLFQHGLGADVSQPIGLLGGLSGVRLIAFDCRNHGATAPAAPKATLSIAQFADDAVALLDHLGLERVVVGGISMGAAVALNLAVRHHDRVAALIASRPALLAEPWPPHLRIYAEVADLIEAHGPDEALSRLRRLPRFEALAGFPDTAASILKQVAAAPPEVVRDRLRAVPGTTAFDSFDDLRGLVVPALVLGTGHDPVHPWSYAEAVASAIPGASLVAVTAKSVSVERHEAEVRQAVAAFLAGLPAIPQPEKGAVR